ncbi:MAG: hypothetical protein IKG14_04100 [Clostridia bacterium]|nr:hypothetical protein [Clostridia bacterium]
MENKIEFEDMSSSEQISKLREIMSQIKALELNFDQNRIISGEFEIEDVSYTRLPNGEVAYEALINHPDGSKSHEYYSENNNSLSKIDVSQIENNVQMLTGEIKKYQSTGMELSELNNSLIENELILDIFQSPGKISLVNLENVKQELMDFAIECGIKPQDIEAIISLSGNSDLQLSKITPEELQKIEQTAIDLGISEQEALEHIRIDENGIKIDSDILPQHDEGEIKGNDKVTTNYTLNQILGLNYDSYRIIKTHSDEPIVVGITQDGKTEIIPDTVVEANSKETKSMSLIRDDGTIKNVGVVASFRLRDTGSSLGRDQAIGICIDNGETTSFYARNAGGDMLIGEELPSRVYTSQRINNENILDSKYNNNIRSEADSAKNRTDDGCLDTVRNLGDGESNNMIYQEDSEELIKKYADKYDIDDNKLRNRFNYEIKNSHSKKYTDEQIIKEQAELINQEEKHEPSMDPGERVRY